ncbi:hypothetical protein [Nitrososphaera sp. AFS]|jgi:hypothetical protein|uniref:hypothetical protein n=1 Tax=Nitrososphaera sp. AFS TaxID=2301191 RepID=UPI0013922037|nr:hypothetical protein [Nitrososphaera sp. AFS]NAL78802.1 hypothetical protein [Nitrososphaera sp. AFS]
MASEIGFSDVLTLAQTIGIVGTMILTLYFSKRQIQALSSDTETRVLNDLDEKFHNMAMLVMEDPSIVRVIETRDYAKQKEVAFSFYILWMCAHAYAMRQRRVLDDNEWTGWLQWMRNCFRKGTLSETWKEVESDGWFNPAFQNFINREVVTK